MHAGSGPPGYTTAGTCPPEEGTCTSVPVEPALEGVCMTTIVAPHGMKTSSAITINPLFLFRRFPGVFS